MATSPNPAPVTQLKETRLLDPDTGEPYVSRRGRPAGAGDIVNSDLRALVHTALHHAGGAEYLYALAHSEVPSDRTAFVGLVSRCMPTEIKGSVQGNFTLEVVNYAQQAQALLDAQRTIDAAPIDNPLLQ
jgi:hypothetical protein